MAIHPDLVRFNPAWTNSALLRSWSALERSVGPSLMPILTEKRVDKIKAVEFGTGAYGTVIPTKTKGWVVKVTSDESEATFAAIAMSLRKFPSGIVHYKRVFHVPGSHDGRPIYILWRQEANHVGDALHGSAKECLKEYYEAAETPFWFVQKYGRRSLKELKSRIKTVSRSPGIVTRVQRHLSDVTDAALEYLDAEYWAEKLSKTREGSSVGKAILFYFDRGILLADLHTGNVGIRGRNSVITDPGHVLLLDDRYRKVRPKELTSGNASVRSTHPRRLPIRRRLGNQ